MRPAHRSSCDTRSSLVAEAGEPIGVKLIGLPTVAQRNGLVSGKDDAEEIQDRSRYAHRVCGEVLMVISFGVTP